MTKPEKNDAEISEIVCNSQEDLDAIPESYRGVVILRTAHRTGNDIRLTIRRNHEGTFKVEDNLFVFVCADDCKIVAYDRACVDCSGRRAYIKAHGSSVIMNCEKSKISAWDDALVLSTSSYGIELHDAAARVGKPDGTFSSNLYSHLLSCLSFVRVSNAWGGLDNGFYTATNDGGWTFSVDNSGGGILVDWAYKRSNSFITANYASIFVEQLLDELQQMIDEEGDVWQLQTLHDKYSGGF